MNDGSVTSNGERTCEILQAEPAGVDYSWDRKGNRYRIILETKRKSNQPIRISVHREKGQKTILVEEFSVLPYFSSFLKNDVGPDFIRAYELMLTASFESGMRVLRDLQKRHRCHYQKFGPAYIN